MVYVTFPSCGAVDIGGLAGCSNEWSTDSKVVIKKEKKTPNRGELAGHVRESGCAPELGRTGILCRYPDCRVREVEEAREIAKPRDESVSEWSVIFTER